MANWKDELNGDPVSWLLENDKTQPAICYYTLRDILGTERIVFASDVPWGTNSGSDRLESYPNQIRSLELPYEVINAIFSDNIRRIIKFP